MSHPSTYLATLLKYAESNLASQLERLEASGYVYRITTAPSRRLRCYVYPYDVYHNNPIRINNSTSSAALVFDVPAPTKTLMSQIRSTTAQAEQIERFLEHRSQFSEFIK